MSGGESVDMTSCKDMDYYTKIKRGFSLLLGENAPIEEIGPNDYHSVRESRKKYKNFIKKYSGLFRMNHSIAEELITKGVDVNATNTVGNTLLHCAINKHNYDLATMLLYYNADTSIADNSGYTPFMLALQRKNDEMQSLLLDHETDFSRVTESGSSVLELAVNCRSELVEEILNKDVRLYLSDRSIDISKVFWMTFDTFRILWDRLDYDNFDWDRYDSAIGYAVERFSPELFEYVVKSDKLQRTLDETYALRDFNPSQLQTRGYTYRYCMAIEELIDYAVRYFSKEVSFELIYILLMHGYEPNYLEVEVICRTFGRCQLFELCLELDLCPSSLSYTNLLTCIILDLSKTIRQHIDCFVKMSIDNSEFKNLENNIVSMSQFSCDRYLRRSYKNLLLTGVELYRRWYPDDASFERNAKEGGLILSASVIEQLNEQIPSLQELSRNIARDYICNKYCITNYTDLRRTLKAMNIGYFDKILTFEMPIYR